MKVHRSIEKGEGKEKKHWRNTASRQNDKSKFSERDISGTAHYK